MEGDIALMRWLSEHQSILLSMAHSITARLTVLISVRGKLGVSLAPNMAAGSMILSYIQGHSVWTFSVRGL